MSETITLLDGHFNKMTAAEVLPDQLLKQTHNELLSKQIGILQDQLGHKGDKDALNYDWIKSVVVPYKSTSEFVKWSDNFAKLKQEFVAKKEDFFAKQKKYYGDQMNHASMELQIKLVTDERDKLVKLEDNAYDEQVGLLNETLIKLQKNLELLPTIQVIKDQKTALDTLKGDLVTQYQGLVKEINNNLKATHEHYQTQMTSNSSKIATWSSTLPTKTSKEYIALVDQLNSIRSQISDKNIAIKALSTTNVGTKNKITNEGVNRDNLFREKYKLFEEYLVAQLKLKAYVGFDKQGALALAALQHSIYTQEQVDMSSIGLVEVDNFYIKERSDHLRNDVSKPALALSTNYLSHKVARVVDVSSNPSLNNWFNTKFDFSMNDFYLGINSDKAEKFKDILGLQSDKQSLKGDLDTYETYKKNTDKTSLYVSNVGIAVNNANVRKSYVGDLIAHEVQTIQQSHIDTIYKYTDNTHKNISLIKGDAETQYVDSIKGINNINEEIEAFKNKNADIKDKEPTTDDEVQRKNQYNTDLARLENKKDEYNINIRNYHDIQKQYGVDYLGPIVRTYKKAKSDYGSVADKPTMPTVVTLTEYPVDSTQLTSFTVDSIDQGDIMDLVTKVKILPAARKESDTPKTPDTPKS